MASRLSDKASNAASHSVVSPPTFRLHSAPGVASPLGWWYPIEISDDNEGSVMQIVYDAETRTATDKISGLSVRFTGFGNLKEGDASFEAHYRGKTFIFSAFWKPFLPKDIEEKIGKDVAARSIEIISRKEYVFNLDSYNTRDFKYFFEEEPRPSLEHFFEVWLESIKKSQGAKVVHGTMPGPEGNRLELTR